MPMPEMPDRLKAIMETKSDQLNELVNYDRQACYAAGKADGRYELLKCDGRFPTIHLIDLEDGNGTQEFVTLKDTEQWGFVCKESAGKADALPQWPPFGNFKNKNSEEKYCFQYNRWFRFVCQNSGRITLNELHTKEQADITAAYFRGELEEVK